MLFLEISDLKSVARDKLPESVVIRIKRDSDYKMLAALGYSQEEPLRQIPLSGGRHGLVFKQFA